MYSYKHKVFEVHIIGGKTNTGRGAKKYNFWQFLSSESIPSEGGVEGQVDIVATVTQQPNFWAR